MTEFRDEVKEMLDEMGERFSSLLARSTEQQDQIIATMTRQHRTTMLALLGVFVAVVASFLVPLLTSISA